MTRNPFIDGTTPFAAQFNSLSNAHLLEAVLEGATLTPGDGDFEVDIGAGIISTGDSLETLEATTVTVDAPDGEDRLDLISTNGTTVTVSKGDPATDPGQPIGEDTPEGEVVLGAAYVRSDAAELLQGDLLDEARTEIAEVFPDLIEPQGAESGLDADTLRGSTDSELTSPIFGDGSDGQITGPVADAGYIAAERYELPGGETQSVDRVLIITATDEIVIDGVIDADGEGASGGAGGSAESDGDDGQDGTYIFAGGAGGGGVANNDTGDGSNGEFPGGGGGGGSNTVDGTGGDGGDGGARTLSERFVETLPSLTSSVYDEIYQQTALAGPGGGGGGGRGSSSGESEATDGGDGGGAVLLIAPEIRGEGIVSAQGADAADVEGSGASQAGAGGGGSGGVIVIAGSNLDTSGIAVDVSAGSGGQGGSSTADGGDGADGQDGETFEVRMN